MGVVEGWAVEGGGEDVVLAVRRAVREDGGRGPGVVALNGALSGGEEGGAGHVLFSFGGCLVRMAFAILKSSTGLAAGFLLGSGGGGCSWKAEVRT